MPSAPSPSRLVLVVMTAVALAAFAACQRPRAPEPAPEAKPSPAREPIDVMAPGGERTLRLEVEPDGYTFVDVAGWPVGRALVDERSVRVTDRQGATVVTVSRTAAGFSLDDGSGVALEGTEGDEGLELSRGGARIGLLGRHALLLPDRTLFVASNAGYVQVVREGAPLLEVRGPVGDAAVYLAWTELPFPERLALMVFSTELL